MHKGDLVRRLAVYALECGVDVESGKGRIWTQPSFKKMGDLKVKNREERTWKGQGPFAGFLAEYLERLDIPHDEKYDFWGIEDYLPELLVAAFETLRENEEGWVSEWRKLYEQDVEHEVVNVTDLGASRMLDQSSAVQTTLGFMMREVIGDEWIEESIDKYCNAQHYALQQTMDKFLRRVWWRGMYKMTMNCNVRGMSGKFGQTELRTFVMAGRVMFTFVRRHQGETRVYFDNKLIDTLPYQEGSVSFVADDSDPLALATRLQSFETDFRTALDMIEDVINNWPESQEERGKIYAANKEVSML